MHYSRAYLDRAVTEDDGLLRFTAASEGVQGDGIDLRMSGAMLERYRANPVFGYGHRYWSREDLPIGRAPEVKLVGSKLKIGVEFDQGDEFAKEVERKYRDGYMNAVSIGFEVNQWEGGQGSYWKGGIAEEWELLEISAVPVPMDASAVVESGRAHGMSLRDVLAGLVPLDPSVTVERDSSSQTRTVRVGEELIQSADPLLLAASIARTLAIGPIREAEQPEPTVIDGIDRAWLRDLIDEFGVDVAAAALETSAEMIRREAIRRFGVARGWWEHDPPELDIADRGAIPAHNTAVVEGEWDGGMAVKNCPASAESLRAIHAWVDSSGDGDKKGSYRLPHHAEPGGPANLAGVRNALARLPQSDIPEADRAAVERHLRTHLNAQTQQDAHPGPDVERDSEPDIDAAQLVAAIFEGIH